MHWETEYELEEENNQMTFPTSKNQHRKQQPNTRYLSQSRGNRHTHPQYIQPLGRKQESHIQIHAEQNKTNP
jgi:hypothetical protein